MTGGAPKQIRHGHKSYPVIERLRAGRHQLLVLERLGGRNRQVYRAYQTGVVGQMRAVHVLPYSRKSLDRLRLLTKLSSAHSNLPFIVDSVRRDDEIFVILKWVEGPTIQDYLRQCREGREPWPSPMIVMNLIRGAAHGCRLLHGRLGLVHGDLHTGNLVLCRHTKRLVPIDFGSAWRIETTRKRSTDDGAVRSYAAPEILGGEGHIGFQCDQFSLMTVAYEMLSGKIPYDGLGGRAGTLDQNEHGGIELRRVSEQLKHPGRLPNSLKNHLDSIVAKGLALDPGERYPSVSDWTAELDRLASSLREQPRLGVANSWLLKQMERISRFWTTDSD